MFKKFNRIAELETLRWEKLHIEQYIFTVRPLLILNDANSFNDELSQTFSLRFYSFYRLDIFVVLIAFI